MHPRRLALCLACALAVSCGGDRAAVRDVRIQIQKGDLERAELELAAVEGPAADRLRREIERMRARRAEVDRRLEEVWDEVGQAHPNRLRGELRELLARERDPLVRRRIERALSDLADRLAEIGAAPPRRGKEAAPAAAPGDPRAAARSNAAAAALADEVRRAIGQREWDAALRLLEPPIPLDAAGAERLRETAAAGMRAEAVDLLERAGELYRRRGPEMARAWLAAQSARFPEGAEQDRLRRQADAFEVRRERAALASRARGEDPAERAEGALPAAAGSAEPDELEALARRRVAAGDLVAARELLLEAGRRTPPGWLREVRLSEAQNLAARLELRRELAEGPQSGGGAGADLGAGGAGPTSRTAEDDPAPWMEAPYESLRDAAARASLSPLAERGLLCERILAASGRAELEAALGELDDAVRAGRIPAVAASVLVASTRGEEPPEGGYARHGGRWIPAAEVAALERAAEIDRLAGLLRRAGPLERDAALAALLEAGGEEAADRPLASRAREAAVELGFGPTLRRLEKLAELRRELDLARADALELIFDEETYFYPYNPPEPPHTAADYARAQRRVDDLVAAVRAVWERSRTVELPQRFTAALDEIAWARARRAELELSPAGAEELPGWLAALPLQRGEVDLASFAWDEEEAAELARSRAVLALNARRLGEEAAGQRAGAPQWPEREQVAITNAYRLMLGRRALAFDPRIYAAARSHSDYMSRTGDFGHFEADPARRTPLDRLLLAGYEHGASENCAQNQGHPESAHQGWLHSSGHHRNILAEGHREMASAVSGGYWTQCFGTGTSHEELLEE